MSLAAAVIVAGFAHASARPHVRPRDLPADAPHALYESQPKLPRAHGWPASNAAFPWTSGTGRLADGGFYWTDFLYDDHGATTASPGDISVTAGSPSFGLYTYPPGPAANNGADIFRAAVALRSRYTYWRVDWNTLKSAKIPIAEWTFDRDDNAKTGAARWPAAAGVSSPGIDTALVMSSRGASLINVASGAVEHRLPVTVTRAAHSFVVRIPRRWLAPKGTWRIRLAAGVADAAGTGFAAAPDAAPGQTHVYNVTFRTIAQEKQSDNFWDDMAQTEALDTGNVSSFSELLHWSQLAHHRQTPQPQPRGWSDRWYVSSVSLGPGLIDGPTTISDGLPNYLGRVQPYAVYIPRSYRPHHPTPLTFLLHSLTQNQNQYAATTPDFTKQACESRHSICVTTLGRGPDGNYFDTAELDFWQVWHSVAAAYDLNPNRTVLCGYSMGGIGTNQLAMAHPDLFAKAVTLAGAIGASPSLVNLRWIPTYLAGGAEDELVPVTVERAEADRLKALGYRYRWLLIPGIDHVAFELADSFADAAAYMGNARRVTNPGAFTFRWSPRNGEDSFGTRAITGGGLSWTQEPKLGVGTTGDYWLRQLQARSAKSDAQVVAHSGERPVPAVKTHASSGIDATAKPEPALLSQQTWTTHRDFTRHRTITLKLTNVASLRILIDAAGFTHRNGTLRLTTDGPVTIRLGHRTIHARAGRHSYPLR